MIVSGALAVSFTQGIEEAWANVAEFVPKLGGALGVLFVGWLIAKAVRGGFERLARKLRFDDLVDRAGLGRWAERLGFADSGVLVARLLYWAVMLVVIQMAIDVFGDSRVQEALGSVVAFLPRLAIALVLLVVTGAVAGRVRELTSATLKTTTYGRGVATGAWAAVWAVGGFAALNQVGVAPVIVTTLFQAAVYTIALILVIKFGVGGVASARDRFWPKVYDRVQGPLPPRPMYAPRPLPPGYPAGYPAGYGVPYPGAVYPPGVVPPGYQPAPGYAPQPGAAPMQPQPQAPAQAAPVQQQVPVGAPAAPVASVIPSSPGGAPQVASAYPTPASSMNGTDPIRGADIDLTE